MTVRKTLLREWLDDVESVAEVLDETAAAVSGTTVTLRFADAMTLAVAVGSLREVCSEMADTLIGRAVRG